MDCVDNQTAEDDAQATEGIPAAVQVATDRAKAEARKISDERRAHRRVPGRALDWINVARVKYGPEVSIVDLSRGGVLLESDRPLKPGSRQALEIAGAEKSIVVPFGVLRSRISALAPRGAIYRSACAFSRPLELPELAAAAVVTELNPIPEPVVAPVPVTATPVSVAPVAVEPVAPEPTTAAIAQPAATEPLTDVAQEPLMETILREVVAPDVEVAPGLQKLVARFLDGTILKGYNSDFDVNRPSFSLQTSPENGSECVSVPLTGLKAVFFVRDFEGKPEYRERKTFVGQTPGRRVHLAFTDGEMIIGTTNGYRAGGNGFFVTPADPRANNVRIFVVSSAVRQVRFP
jgi:hypothetical protein